VKILIIDSNVLFRSGVRFLLHRLDAHLSLDEAGEHAEALERLGSRKYDLVLLDINLPGVQGLDALQEYRNCASDTSFVMLSDPDDLRLMHAIFEHGALGFLPKSSTPDVLYQTLKLILAQRTYLSPDVLDVPVRSHASSPGLPPSSPEPTTLPWLTARQTEVLRGVIQGKTNKAIAKELNRSVATVKAHLSATFRALGVTSRTEAIYSASVLGLRVDRRGRGRRIDARKDSSTESIEAESP
jgi:DNA-binding NarL/FixJ family response regulator